MTVMKDGYLRLIERVGLGCGLHALDRPPGLVFTFQFGALHAIVIFVLVNFLVSRRPFSQKGPFVVTSGALLEDGTSCPCQ